MGLFDRFGAGGGKLEIHPNGVQFGPGQVLSGTVSFTGGSRPQQVTNIKLKFTHSQQYMEQTPQGPQQRSRSQAVAPEITVTGPFTSTPGQRQDFPFQIQLPAQLVSSAPQVSSYNLAASADIDNEIDPGDNQAIQIVGGMPAGGMPGQPMMGGMPGQPMMGGMPGQPMMGGMPGQPMMGGMPGQPMMGGMPGQPMMGGMPGQPMMQQAMGAVAGVAMGAAVGAAPLGVGSRVLAQWQDGQFHPGTIVSAQNGYFAVDWENPALGQTTWVMPNQVQPMMGGMPAQPMMGGMPAQPMMGGMPAQPMMGGMPAQPMKAAMPMDKQAAMAKGAMPMDKHAAMGKGGGLHVGAFVMAQAPDGQWHKGRIVSQQNGYHAVDWDDPRLGQTTWLMDHQVRPA